MKKKITCIVCPRGCEMSIDYETGKIISISENQCQRGEEYAKTELFDPKRILTTTVKLIGGVYPVLPVKTNKPIKKEMIMKCMEEISKITVLAPICCGDVIISNILDTEVDVVSTADS